MLKQSEQGMQQETASEDDGLDDLKTLKAWLYCCLQCEARFKKRRYLLLMPSKIEACPKCGGNDIEMLTCGSAELVAGWAHSLYLGLDDSFHRP